MVESGGKRIVLTADRSLMTNYRGNFLYGFIACGPYELVPEFVFDKLFCPSVETDHSTGEVKVAQCGLRRIEGALLKEYRRDEIFLAHPEMLAKCIGPDTKVVGINVMDPLGMVKHVQGVGKRRPLKVCMLLGDLDLSRWSRCKIKPDLLF